MLLKSKNSTGWLWATGWLWVAQPTTASAPIVLVIFLAICLSTTTARAIVVLPKGVEQPVMGYLVREDERTVVVRQEQPGGKSRELTFAKRDLDELIVTVAPDRLAELDPARPKTYREYAEELAEKQRDPEARDAAIRLYAIAAVRGDERLRRGALLGLISLARSADEERLFRAAAYLFDPGHDAAILADPASEVHPGASPKSAELMSVIRQARQGKGSAAKATLARPAVQADAERIASIISLDELTEACAATRLTREQLRKLLRAELALESTIAPQAAAEKPPAQPAGWSQSASQGRLAPLPRLSLDSLTEFDPAACLYRSGKWVEP